MPELVACPNCDRKLKVPETLLGKRVRCPACKTVFAAKAVSAAARPAAKKTPPAGTRRPAEDDDGPEQYDVAVEEKPEEEDEDGRPKRGILEEHLRKQIQDDRQKRGKRPFSDEWRKARLGLRIVSLAALILIANIIVQTAGRGIIFMITKPDYLEEHPTQQQRDAYNKRVQESEQERKGAERYLGSAAAIIYLVHHVVALVGIGIGLLSPDKNYLKLLAGAALLVALGGLGLEVGTSIAPLQYLTSGATDGQGNILPPHPALKIATDAVGYLRWFVFLFFLRMVAITTKAEDLKREVLMLMFALPVAFLFWLVMAILTAVKITSSPSWPVGSVIIEGSVIGVIGTCSLALVLAMVVWFAMTVHTTTVAITDWLRER